MASGVDRGEAAVLLACSMNGTAYPRTTPSYLALGTTVPTSTVRATEVQGGSYGRVQVPFSISTITASNTGSATLTGLPAGTVRSIETYDAPTNGNRRWFADLPSPYITVNAGDAISFAPGVIVFTLGT